jgi:ATP-binding cassette, subfamily F, member 3
MLLDLLNLSKSIDSKSLFHDVSLRINEGEKIALIGRNGQGKTTLLKMLAGEDTDYSGSIVTRKNTRITLTKQEHITDITQSAVTYILHSVPQYFELQKILTEYAAGSNTNLNQYLEALEFFTDHGYYHIEDSILGTLASFQISNEQARMPLAKLSGGEKRYVELARMMFSDADLYLVDEPTNHMDYIGKQQFINWLLAQKKSVLVVTHDRDVLNQVTTILELKDQKLVVFNGNYKHYLEKNVFMATSSMKNYQDQLNALKEAKKRVAWGLTMRAKSKEWKIRYDHWLRDYEKLKAEMEKPSLWIDQTSTDGLDKHELVSYEKFKEKNIVIGSGRETKQLSELLTITQLSLGYTEPLFEGLSITLTNQNRLLIKGRNGAGKSSLVKTILATHRDKPAQATVYQGEVRLGAGIRIGEYEQEIHPQYLEMGLEDAIRAAYDAAGVSIDESKVKSLLAQYLFDPRLDAQQRIAHLSGGQKARFQLIKMLANNPHLLILDEPTNHLDLPSIEELENALRKFKGGVLYISHDTYFIEQMSGMVVEI